MQRTALRAAADAERQPERDSMASELITVGTYVVLAEAHLAKAALSREGIEGFVGNEFLDGLGEASEPIVIKVRAEDQEKAVRVLQRVDSGLRNQITRGEPLVCPDCGGNSTEVVRKPPDRALARLLYALLHDAGRAACRCNRCGHQWEARW